MSIDPSSRIIRRSRRMACLVTAAFWLLIPGLALYVLVFPEQLPYHGWVAMAGFKPRPLPPLVATAVFGALSVVSLPALWGLWALKKLFEGFATGAIFTIAAARRLRHCGYALMVAAGLSPIGSMLLSAALSLDLPKNGRSLVISLSTDDLVLLLIGGVLLVVARVMEEAARIAEENAGFV